MNRPAAVAIAALVLGTAGSVSGQDLEKGKQVYAAATPKCKTCHSIGGQGNPKGALDGVRSRLGAAEIRAWVRTPRDAAARAKADRTPPMPAYSKDRISDADLEDLTAYLLSLGK